VASARVLPLVLFAIIVGAPAAAAAQDARAAVEAFVTRLADVRINDLEIQQTVTLYHQDGRHPISAGEQRMLFKLPQRQRIEQILEGQREVQVTVGNRAWVRRADGKVYDAKAVDSVRALASVVIPFQRRASELLADWRARGVRDDVSHVARIGRRTVTVIGARPGERDVPAVWLDGEYGVVRIVTRERLPNGPKLVDLALSEHRPLTGAYFFPGRQEAFIDGKLVVLITVRSIQANTNPADALFDPEALRREH
jgi:outer membrane lipoprotein-sorting protein